jgi:hypothetical protein|tara:strand:+ start:24479 stop:25285 length:807 start_codon:yes stop_codon:yes gene_type:complete
MEQRDPGKDEPSLRYNFKKAKDAGYDGLCLDLTVEEIDDFKEVHNLFDEFNLGCMVNAFPMRPSDMQPLIRVAKSLNAPLINIISGVMPLKPADAVPCVKKWLAEAKESDIDILFETHRDGLLNDLFFTLQLMDLVPEMRLCADLSHFVIDRELRLPVPERDRAFLNNVLERSDCFQGRIANREQIQIQIDFPQHKEWVNQFKIWWRDGIRMWRKRNDSNAILIFLCELGPRPYAITDKNQEELSDRWEEALIIRKWVEDIWIELENE